MSDPNSLALLSINRQFPVVVYMACWRRWGCLLCRLQPQTAHKKYPSFIVLAVSTIKGLFPHKMHKNQLDQTALTSSNLFKWTKSQWQSVSIRSILSNGQQIILPMTVMEKPLCTLKMSWATLSESWRDREIEWKRNKCGANARLGTYFDSLRA